MSVYRCTCVCTYPFLCQTPVAVWQHRLALQPQFCNFINNLGIYCETPKCLSIKKPVWKQYTMGATHSGTKWQCVKSPNFQQITNPNPSQIWKIPQFPSSSSCLIMFHPLPPFFSVKSPGPPWFPTWVKTGPPRANLGAAQQAGADLHRRGAQQQRRGRLPRVAQTARGDHRDLHGVHDLRQQRLGRWQQNGMMGWWENQM